MNRPLPAVLLAMAARGCSIVNLSQAPASVQKHAEVGSQSCRPIQLKLILFFFFAGKPPFFRMAKP